MLIDISGGGWDGGMARAVSGESGYSCVVAIRLPDIMRPGLVHTEKTVWMELGQAYLGHQKGVALAILVGTHSLEFQRSKGGKGLGCCDGWRVTFQFWNREFTGGGVQIFTIENLEWFTEHSLEQHFKTHCDTNGAKAGKDNPCSFDKATVKSHWPHLMHINTIVSARETTVVGPRCRRRLRKSVIQSFIHSLPQSVALTRHSLTLTLWCNQRVLTLRLMYGLYLSDLISLFPAM